MWDPNTETFSFSLLEQRYTQYRRGLIPKADLLRDFFDQVDPDALRDAFQLFDENLTDAIRDLLLSSPATDRDWTIIRRKHRTKADLLAEKLKNQTPLGHGDRIFIFDEDGFWVLPGLGNTLRRFLVFALREVCDLPNPEVEWAAWKQEQDTPISNLGLHPWVLENRVRWYAYLNWASIGSYRFASAPRSKSFPLHIAEASGDEPSIENLRRRLEFVEKHYPDSFYTVRKVLRGRMVDRKRSTT